VYSLPRQCFFFEDPLPSNDKGYTYRYADWVVEMSSGAVMYIPSFIKTSPAIEKLVWGIHRQHGDPISVFSLFQNKQSRIKKQRLCLPATSAHLCVRSLSLAFAWFRCFPPSGSGGRWDVWRLVLAPFKSSSDFNVPITQSLSMSVISLWRLTNETLHCCDSNNFFCFDPRYGASDPKLPSCYKVVNCLLLRQFNYYTYYN
jgi:hypothetical protein